MVAVQVHTHCLRTHSHSPTAYLLRTCCAHTLPHTHSHSPIQDITRPSFPDTLLVTTCVSMHGTFWTATHSFSGDCATQIMQFRHTHTHTNTPSLSPLHEFLWPCPLHPPPAWLHHSCIARPRSTCLVSRHLCVHVCVMCRVKQNQMYVCTYVCMYVCMY